MGADGQDRSKNEEDRREPVDAGHDEEEEPRQADEGPAGHLREGLPRLVLQPDEHGAEGRE